MIYKYRSIYEVIEKVYRDSGFSEEISLEDMVVWASEALDFIGAKQQYISKVTGDLDNPDLDITDYKAKLPCDFHKLSQIAVNGEPAEYVGNTFHHLKGGDCCTTNGIDESGTVTSWNDNFGNTFSSILGNSDTSDLQGYTYDINNNYITLNVETGKVCISYIAVPTDENGYPMIPDDEAYIKAVSRYIIMMHDYILWRTGKITSEIFKHSEREWFWCVGQARAAGLKPNLDMMENLKGQFVKLIPGIKHHGTFFK